MTQTYAVAYPGEEAPNTWDIALWLNGLIGKELPLKPGWRFSAILSISMNEIHEGQSFYALALMEIVPVAKLRQPQGEYHK